MVSPPDTTGGFGSSVDASEPTEVSDLDDLTDLMLGNLMLHVRVEHKKKLAITIACRQLILRVETFESFNNQKSTDSACQPLLL